MVSPIPNGGIVIGLHRKQIVSRTVLQFQQISVLPRTAPLIVLAQYCLFRSFNEAPHWLMAWAVFTVGNSIMRVSVVRFFGADVSNWPYAIAGISVMMGGAFLVKESLR